MKSTKIISCLVGGLAVVLCATLFVAAARSAQEPETKSNKDQPARLILSLQGPDLYRAYCASCHGADGRGNGPVAPALATHLPDLTTISKRNGGVFPAERIERIISGDEVIISHGSREMPIWGPIFHRVEEDRDFGNVRLHNVTKHLEMIQQK